jgi:hypothetical protein
MARRGCLSPLGPADEHAADRQKKARNQQGPDRVDVTQWIQTQPPEILGGAVAANPRRPPVRNLVQSNGKQRRNCPNRYLLQKIR